MVNQHRPIFEITKDIKKDWQNVYFAAVPYLEAMFTLNSIEDPFYEDSGREIVIQFLSNATFWRGPVAREIKKELNNLLNT